MVYNCKDLFEVNSLDVNLPEGCKAENCVAEGFLRYIYEFMTDDNEKMTVEYTLTVCDDSATPYGIKAVMRNAKQNIVDSGSVYRKFATLSECELRMRLMVFDNTAPCAVEYI